MKYIHRYALPWIVVFSTFCKGPNKTDLAKDNIKSGTKDAITSYGPDNITRNIIQDRSGNIWIAAFDGIFRFDGKSFANITSEVSPARFFSVIEDRKGNLWFGSIGSGVYSYDGKSFRNFSTMDGLVSNEIVCIYEDKIGNIWFGGNGGVSRYDGKFFQNYTMRGDSITEDTTRNSLLNSTTKEKRSGGTVNEVTSIIEDKTGKFWFATRGHTFVYDGKEFNTLAHNGKPFENVRSIIQDKDGGIWLGGSSGLWRYDGRTFTNITQNFVGYIYEDKKGSIWTSSQRAGDGRWLLSRYDKNTSLSKKPTVTKIESEYEDNRGMIFGILEADDGNIWLGTLNGVRRYDGKTITDFKSKESRKGAP